MSEKGLIYKLRLNLLNLQQINTFFFDYLINVTYTL